MTQLTRLDMRSMTPAQIVAAHEAGQFDTIIRAGHDAELIERAQVGVVEYGDYPRLNELGRADLFTRAIEDGRINKENNQ